MALQFKCIDTMKLSRDNSSLTAQQIQDRVNQYAGLGLTHLTVDCFLNGSFHDDTDRENWVAAVRNLGLKVWWRPAYVNFPATPELMTEMLTAFPERRHDLFQNGDIFDMLPEQNPFMESAGNPIFGSTLNEMVDGWNVWVRGVKDDLDAIFASHGKSGVITGITSITDFNAKNYVKVETYQHFGYACMDDYPADSFRNPALAARAVTSSLQALYNKAGVPVVVGEFGYTRSSNIDHRIQRACLRQIWNECSKLPWLEGYNYWVGHGGSGFGDNCNLLELDSGNWVPRSALKTIEGFYKRGRATERMLVV